MFGKIVLVFAILAVTSTSWIEAAPPGYEDSFSLDPDSKEPPKCGINEYWIRYGPYCQPTCQEPVIPSCIKMAMSGCVCKAGYIRRTPQSECIEIKNCPSKNDVNAEDKKKDDDLFSIFKYGETMER